MPRTAKKTDEAGLGNLSPEDLAAIAGTVDTNMTASELLTYGTSAVIPLATPEEVSMASRVLTLEGRLSDLEKAVETLAQTTTGAAVSAHKQLAQQDAPVPTHKPSEAETDAYFKANYELTSKGKPAFNGIQDWRNHGSPGLAR